MAALKIMVNQFMALKLAIHQADQLRQLQRLNGFVRQAHNFNKT
jgi:hypothetical protein